MQTIHWQCNSFTNLCPLSLYDLLRLRSEVFVVEQNCIFLDADNVDQLCYHISGYVKNKLVAYTRLVPAGILYTEVSIGRVVTAKEERGEGIGRLLMVYSIAKIYELFGKQPIQIGAQLYLKQFYESLGFIQISDCYLEDGIEHIHMIKSVK